MLLYMLERFRMAIIHLFNEFLNSLLKNIKTKLWLQKPTKNLKVKLFSF